MGGDGVRRVFAQLVDVWDGEGVWCPGVDERGVRKVFERRSGGGVQLKDEEFLVWGKRCSEIVFKRVVVPEVGLTERDEVKPFVVGPESRQGVCGGRKRGVERVREMGRQEGG